MLNEVKLARTQLVEIYKTLADRNAKSFSPKFSFFLLRNNKFLEDEIKILDEVNSNINENLKPYEDARIALINELGDKNEDGSLKTNSDGGATIQLENTESFQNRMKELTEEYKDLIDTHTELSTQLQELYTEEVSQKVLKISYLDIPENEFSVQELTILTHFIKETEEELDELLMG